jgi:hypothetical protein
MRYLALALLACLSTAGAYAQQSTAPVDTPHKSTTPAIADAIMSQFLARSCWADQDDLAVARKLRAVFAIQLGRDGHFAVPPKLIVPEAEPKNDPTLQTFIARARAALDKCNAMGFQVPEAYFSYTPPLIIELDFRP